MGVYLVGVYLMGVYLIGMHLVGVSLTGVHLMGVHLTERAPHRHVPRGRASRIGHPIGMPLTGAI
jgi:hypothetical protein